jgi:predicted ATPase/class 3 adenylate cyclase
LNAGTSGENCCNERWQRIEKIFNAAVECTAVNRVRLLARECGDDSALRREVEQLLEAHERSGLVDTLATKLEAPARWRSRIDAVEWADRRVAQYLVLAPLGAGAMGWVYKARDERLGRMVALKFLPPHLISHEGAKNRFLLEARAAAALDHPNICTVHEIGEAPDGQMYISMPLYEGETLQTRLDRGPLAAAELIHIALQVASGLGRAHQQGIVHRDVKPSNVMLLNDGSVKILDFGIAHIEDASLGASAGMTMGTLAYMSPEQARGEGVDPRMDVWALGIVLHEMATGSRPFDGVDARALRAAIESGELEPITARRPDAPIELDAIVRKMLAKSASQRYASIAKVEAELGALIEREQYPAAALKHGHSVGAVATSERRHAAVLVTIVSDYAMLVEQHAVEEIEALMARVRNSAVDVVRQHGGLVNHAFDEEIVALFGVPAGHEDDELRAVRAAMELHRRVAELGTQMFGHRGPAIRLRTGVRSGLIVSQRLNSGPRRYAVSGGVVQGAYRLAILAARDAILVTPECQRLITPFIHTVPEGAVTLLADEGTTTPHRVLGESGLQARIDAAVRKGLTAYTGRQPELASLIERFAPARDGRGQIALIIGEAGVGKSRLLYELRSRIVGANIRELSARCQSYGGTAPYQPFIDVLRQALQLGPQREDRPSVATVVERVRAIDGSLVQFVPLYLHLLSLTSDEYPLPRDLRGEHLQQAVPEALAALLTRFAGSVATVMWLEDWHWSDEGSRAALHRLVEIVPSHPLFVVVTSRPAGVEQIEWSSQVPQITLGALDFHASTDIIRDVLRVEHVSAELAQRLFERTGGNPFFLEEICHALTETGAVATVGGEGVVAGGVAALQLPDTVQAVIRTRLDALDKDAREVLRIASVIGREFAHVLLADVSGDKLDIAPALDCLTRAGLIQQSSVPPEVTYRFNHVLTHEVTYESLLNHQRRSWHSVIGTALERLTPRQADEQAELLAHHFALAESWASAIDHGSRAAERARALSQFADALSMLDRVRSYIDRLPEADDRRADRIADVLLWQERLCETLGKRGRQQQIVDELIALLAPGGTSSRLAQAYQRQGDLLTLLRRFDAADRALGTALRVSREHGNSALERQALRSLGLLRWHEGRHQEALAMTERALEIDRERCDDLAVAGDLANVSTILKGMGEHELAIAKTEEALAIPALAKSPANLSYSLQNLANIYRDAGNPQRAMEVLQRANELTRIHLLPIQRSFHLMAIAHIYLQQGQIERSLQTYQESVELSRRARYADGLVQSLRALGEVLEGLGRDEEALPRLQEAATLFAQLEDRAGEAQMWNRIGTIADRCGNGPQAMQAWQSMRELCTKLGDIDGELQALEGTARAVRSSSGNSDEAIAAAEAALALAVTLGAQCRELTSRNILGIMHWERMEYSRALRHYELALRLTRVLSDRVHEGLMLNSLGITLSRLHRHEEARTALEESVALNRATNQRLFESHALTALGDIHRMRQRSKLARECYEQSLDLRRALDDVAGEAQLIQRLAQLATDQE